MWETQGHQQLRRRFVGSASIPTICFYGDLRDGFLGLHGYITLADIAEVTESTCPPGCTSGKIC